MTQAAWVTAFVAIVSWTTVAGAQGCPCACPRPDDLVGCCAPACDPQPPTIDGELYAVMAAGVALAASAWAFTIGYVSTQPHSWMPMDAVPVVGNIAYAVRRDQDPRVPLVLFAAGVEVIGALVAATVGLELARQPKWIRVDVSASRDGAGVLLGMRLP